MADVELALVRLANSDLVAVRQFYLIYVTLVGSAEEIGLNRKELDELVRVRFSELFTGFPLRDLPSNANNFPKEEFNEREWAYLSVVIWTVGTDSVAYHVALKMGKFRGGESCYEDALLGFASAGVLKDGPLLSSGVTDLMERAAVTLRKVQATVKASGVVS